MKENWKKIAIKCHELSSIYLLAFMFFVVLVYSVTAISLGRFPSLNENDNEIIIKGIGRYWLGYLYLMSCFTFVIFLISILLRAIFYRSSILPKHFFVSGLLFVFYFLLFLNVKGVLWWLLG